MLRRRYHLDALSFAVFFVLFNFNGYITARMEVGHTMWCGYFLLPFFSLYLLEWLEESGSLMPALKMAMVLFGMLLLGLAPYGDLVLDFPVPVDALPTSLLAAGALGRGALWRADGRVPVTPRGASPIGDRR